MASVVSGSSIFALPRQDTIFTEPVRTGGVTFHLKRGIPFLEKWFASSLITDPEEGMAYKGTRVDLPLIYSYLGLFTSNIRYKRLTVWPPSWK